MFADIDQLDPKSYILIKGARVNNLKNIQVAIPRNQLVVITGLSGSGKSSLAFDTLFAEGQRMYVESLSAYARQFLGRMEKPDVDYIRGISPAIAVEQKGNSRNPRATVGTTTEIYDYLKLLYARIGRTFSPVSGQEVRKDTVTDVVDTILAYPEGQKLLILAPLVPLQGRSLAEELKIVFQKGFSRLQHQQQILMIEDLLAQPETIAQLTQAVYILIDRNVVHHNDEDNQYRLADSVQTAFYEGQGTCVVEILGEGTRFFSDRFELDGLSFETPSVPFFSFNSPYGACKRCGGFGTTLAIDEKLVIPNPHLSVYEGAIAPWQTEKMSAWQEPLLKNAIKFDFPIHRAYIDLDESQKQLLWDGNAYFQGLHDFFAYIESESYKIQYRVMLSRYRGKVICPDCRGTRLRKDANYVKIGNASLSDLVLMPIRELSQWFKTLSLSEYEQKIARRLRIEIENRLEYLDKVGLGYLTLNRLTASLSGGEFQRIKLATALGSALVGSMYILDEPSIGLHPRDTNRLVGVLRDLQKMGNTVIVVEHEEEVMRAADRIIDIGPQAGNLGGELLFNLPYEDVVQGDEDTGLSAKNAWKNPRYALSESHTYNFLRQLDNIPIPQKRRPWTEYIQVNGARQNNLQNLTVRFPLDVLTVVTGVSGSGKSTLVKEILHPALLKSLGQKPEFLGEYESLEGSLRYVKGVEMVDQNPIGRSTRSNPATFTKVYDLIRDLFAQQALARQRNFTAAHFSFNVEKGRCETCQGEGKIRVDMQFMADVFLTCETCQGKRFKQEVLEVNFQEKDIAEVLDLTIDEAIAFFGTYPKIGAALQPLLDVGLGYVRLGQPTSTLSGGESQRLKLASFLKEKTGHTLFIFDEPTTGLHYHDIRKLLKALQALIDQGNSVLIIEHNLEVIKCADWVIDLGPEGGKGGGQLCFEGTPENLIRLEDNHTAQFLKDKFD
ncbi:MAG: excinuclease ABC subunit UvrA [Microscillaceae bacterium]